MKYVLEAIRPDRFHVWQSSWMDHREVYDEWISLGEDHYTNTGLWGKFLNPERQELNRALALEAFLRLLDSVGSHECLAYNLDGRPFLRLDADLVAVLALGGDDSEEASTTLWIDGESWLPAKAEASAVVQEEGIPVRLEVEQVFYDFDADISISRPRVGLEPSGEGRLEPSGEGHWVVIDDQQWENFFTSFCETRDPSGALEFIEFSAEDAQAETRESSNLAYFCARVAQLVPELVGGIEELYERRRLPLVRDVLAQISDQTRSWLAGRLHDEWFSSERVEISAALAGPFPRWDPLNQVPATALDLDLLWAEFLASGDTTAVLAVIGVLEREDLLRRRIESWLREGKHRNPFRKPASVMRRLHEAANIDWDPSTGRIRTLEDLDCRAAGEGERFEPFRSRERFKAVTQALRFRLSEEERTRIGTKAAARWSIGANSIQHGAVLGTCEEQCRSRSGPVRLALLEILTRAHAARGDRLRAIQFAREYVDLNPTDQSESPQLYALAASSAE